ncbi:MAG: hypothetical protein WB870_06265 [Gallionellaceae bacterium]
MTIKQLTRLIPAGLCLAFSCLLVACLGGGSSATTPVIPNPVTPTLALFAGNMGGAGNNDGPEATHTLMRRTLLLLTHQAMSMWPITTSSARSRQPE